MTLSHQGQRVLITAAAAGLGRAMAEAFLAQGARVHICDVAPEAVARLRAEAPAISATVADVSQPAQVDALFAEVVAALGGLDVLINNAGIAGPTALTEDVSVEAWDHTLAVNLHGQFYCARRAIPLLKQAGGGVILNLSSTAGQMGYPMRAPYAASKWAVIGFTKTLAMELGEFQIRVNALCPGSVAGPRMDRVIAAEAQARGVPEAQIREGYTRLVSLQTFVRPDDIAQLALFLCSPAGARISGQALAVDGHTESARNWTMA